MKHNPLPEHMHQLVNTRHHDVVTVLYCIARYLSIFLLIGLCVISTLYAVGNLVTIQAKNFTCPQYTEEQIRRFDYLNENNHGDADSCHYIDTKIEY